MTSTAPFNPTRLILLSELSTKQKEIYYTLLINNETKFHRNDTGQYIANVRLLAPGIKKDNGRRRRGPQQTNSLLLEERLMNLQEEGRVDISIIGVDDFDYHSYPRFSVLIANNGDEVQPRPKLLSWLMRYIEDLYDSRFAHEAAEIGRDDAGEVTEKVSTIFPVFVVKQLSMKVGLRSLVDQTCWDLLYNAHVYRRDYLEVEMFCRFLQEFYDHDDLLFFLYVRSVVAKQLHVSFKTRWAKTDGPGRQPKSLWLSYRECVNVARAVFGDANEGMCRDFLAIVSPQMVGQKAPADGTGGDTRRIDITQFLHLAVVGYHQTRPPAEGEEGYGGTGAVPTDPGYTARSMPGEVVPPVPSVAPSGGEYMSRFAPRPVALEEENAYSRDSYKSSSMLDEEYLSRLQRDREEMMAMQRQMQMMGGDVDDIGEGIGGDTSAFFQFNPDSDFMDPIMSDENIDLAGLAATSPIPLSSSTGKAPAVHENDQGQGQNSGRRASGVQSAGRRPSTQPRLSLADFAKQRQQQTNPMNEEDGGYEQSGPWNSENFHDELLDEGKDDDDNDNKQEEFIVDDGELSDVRAGREREFLELFCDELSGLPSEIATSIIDELADRLNNKLSAYLSTLDIPRDPDAFDDIVVNFLQSEELQNDMESARDLMVDYVRDRVPQDPWTGEEGPDGYSSEMH
mmetsp:Transcript_3092/g.4755  ORF Transcript_3092/g.4755 Transcript_3092/m.4755 type:complete len:680 (+) Transcript_3092:79-2118(+)|eukprot:CAMPEP_0185017754 /NCGR_PEP_ID=MMETSP1103-20130426/661_1 /TAXON_ID=36769 /ORGANISM="Paraphysomonas bandaiensis, Strain Caron Lab Isolate" /LENGTH=679 /DNA_ID=CAMNT_0027547321 /DNA_START=79 /DNA_END=2118 /DNA_ORIENTATION=+